jgi:hypothetical protein
VKRANANPNQQGSTITTLFHTAVLTGRNQPASISTTFSQPYMHGHPLTAMHHRITHLIAPMPIHLMLLPFHLREAVNV